MNVQFTKEGRVLIAKLIRPKVNALNSEMMYELIQGLQEYDKDDSIGCFIITGTNQSFSGGADITEMFSKSYYDMVEEDYFSYWELLPKLKTPKIAAVNGFALGGGCELAMMCDIIYASSNAVFGQPEIKLGVIPGIGGTQRLTRLIGKSKAMEIILTGRHIDALEAERIGLVSCVFEEDVFWNETITRATLIADHSKKASVIAKELINMTWENNLKDGIKLERNAFHQLFKTSDQKEGMKAFLEKRKPNFN